MFIFDIDLVFVVYLALGFVGLFALSLFYDRRDRRILDVKRDRVVYHCIKCGHIYVDTKISEEMDCPECHFTNGRLRF